jgi:molybdopterin synthase catalytic subunit
MDHITERPIHLEDFFSCVPDRSCGAMASFVGIVRNHDHGRPVRKLYYDCYLSMADRMIGRLIQEALGRWDVHEMRVLHRIGELAVGEAAVAIAVSSAHRDEAFSACRFAIEEIKKKVPIWKKEIFEDGSREWVVCAHVQIESAS